MARAKKTQSKKSPTRKSPSKAKKAPAKKAAKAAPKRAAQKARPKKAAQKRTAALRARPRKAVASRRRGSMTAAEAMLLELHPLDDVQRDAFASQISDEKCKELGTRTKSEAVLKDAMSFANDIAATRRDNPDAVRRYTEARFAWLLECIVALEQARARADAARDDSKPVAEALEHAKARATRVRADLLHTLDLLASEHDADERELADAAGTAEDLVDSLQGLAKLGDRWLRRSDGASKALVSCVDLRRGDVDAAWSAAEELENATARAAGRAAPSGERDPVSVNQTEGRVLYEMRYAMRAFAHAHETSPAVPKLAFGPGTKHAFGARSASNGKPVASTPAAPVADAPPPPPA